MSSTCHMRFSITGHDTRPYTIMGETCNLRVLGTLLDRVTLTHWPPIVLNGPHSYIPKLSLTQLPKFSIFQYKVQSSNQMSDHGPKPYKIRPVQQKSHLNWPKMSGKISRKLYIIINNTLRSSKIFIGPLTFAKSLDWMSSKTKSLFWRLGAYKI